MMSVPHNIIVDMSNIMMLVEGHDKCQIPKQWLILVGIGRPNLSIYKMVTCMETQGFVSLVSPRLGCLI